MIELATLARKLTPTERASLQRGIGRALREGSEIALPGTAFVSIYERGRLIGCIGHETLHGALNMARTDPRFGGARAAQETHTIQVSFLACPALTHARDVASKLEVGTHGLIALDQGRARTVLLPDVARDSMLDAPGMLLALARKLGVELSTLDELAFIESERFVFRPKRVSLRRMTLADLAARWLAQRVGGDGSIAWGVDARAARTHRTGAFHLGRSAVVIAALEAHGGHPKHAVRARRWLSARIREGGEGWPRDAAGQAGTLALAMRAGLPLEAPLLALLEREGTEIAEQPWHAAQVVSVLGDRAGMSVVEGALAPLTKDVWAPWSVLAADAVNERSLASRGRRRIVEAFAKGPPHAGGVGAGTVPEVALTALAVEVLATNTSHDSSVVEVMKRARTFLEAQCFQNAERIPAALDPKLAHGAFPLAPHADFLRSDVTAHALLALLGRPQTG